MLKQGTLVLHYIVHAHKFLGGLAISFYLVDLVPMVPKRSATIVVLQEEIINHLGTELLSQIPSTEKPSEN
jgi:hypothetical protein